MRNYYAAASFIGCVVLLILFIRMKELESPTNYKKRFKKLLLLTIAICIDDLLFGLSYNGSYFKNRYLFYVITYGYFTLTALVNKAWMEYCAIRLKNRKVGDLFTAIAWVSFFLQAIIICSNIFTKDVFYIRADYSYVVGLSRTLIFGLQALNAVFLLISAFFTQKDMEIYDSKEREFSILIDCMVLFTNYFTWDDTESPMFSLGFMIICLSIYVLDITQLLVVKNRKLMTQHKDILREQDTVHEVYIQAQKANEAKRNFLATISHDMRTPMNSIMGMTAIARANLNNPDKVRDCLDRVTYSSEQLLNLINEILDMNKIESGSVSLHTDFISLSEQFSMVIDIVSNQMQQKHLNFETNIMKLTHDDVFGDAKRVQQCCITLLTNAIQYTAENGTIYFSVREIPSETAMRGCYEISVRDTGIGINPAEINHIFDPFYRTSDPRVQSQPGSGIGLAIVKNIANMMNGTITVDSQPEKGSTFTMTLCFALADEHEILNPKNLEGHSVLIVDSNPVSCESMLYIINQLGMTGEYVNRTQDAINRISERKNTDTMYSAVIVDWKIPNTTGKETALAIRGIMGDALPILVSSSYDWADLEDDSTNCKINGFISKPLEKERLESTLATVILGSVSAKQRVNELREKKLNLSELKALLVEDNDLTREIAIELLQMNDMTVDYAINGLDAVQMIKNCEDGTYDFILMDIQMPIMNGFEATQAIRELDREYAKKVPIIAMTANAFTEDKIAAQSAGMNDHLAKPLDIPQLIETLKKYL